MWYEDFREPVLLQNTASAINRETNIRQLLAWPPSQASRVMSFFQSTGTCDAGEHWTMFGHIPHTQSYAQGVKRHHTIAAWFRYICQGQEASVDDGSTSHPIV